MVISRSITRNLRSTVFSLHRQELMAVTTLLPVYKQWGYQKQLTVEPVVYPLPVNTVCCVWAHSIHDRQDPGTYHSILSKITPVGVQILAGQYNAPATAYSGISAYWGMIGC